MKNKIIRSLLIVILMITVLVIYASIHPNQIQKINFIQGKNIISPTPSPTPIPTPIILNEKSDLKRELEKLTPSDFSGDFKFLKEETSKF